jgi:hypothetical protein
MTEIYSIIEHFSGNTPNSTQLISEIESNSDIVTPINGITINEDIVEFLFNTSISETEKSALNLIVSNHIPGPIIKYEKINTVHFVIFDYKQNYMSNSSSTVWKICNFYPYGGSDNDGLIIKFALVVSADKDTSGKAELYIIGSKTIISTLVWSDGSINNPIAIETNNIQNCPSSSIMLGLRFIKTDGSSTKSVNIHNFKLSIAQ